MLAEKRCGGLNRQRCTAGPSQNATFPNFNSSRIIHVPTDLTYVLARVLVFNDSDQAAANALSQNITISPYNASGLILHASLLLFRDICNTQMHSACSADNVAVDIVLAGLGLSGRLCTVQVSKPKCTLQGKQQKLLRFLLHLMAVGMAHWELRLVMSHPCCSGQPPGSMQLLLMSQLIPQVIHHCKVAIT